MSKFHINKHGVPAPCKATKGNCPLGGEERHFDSQEAAQEYADKVNAEKHGVLPGINPSGSGTITHTADPDKFAELFPDVYDESGFTQSGAILGEVQESAYVSRADVEEVLPKEISDKVFNEENEDIIMIKENDIAEHINRWALRGQPSDYEDTEFYQFRENETMPYLRENFPDDVVEFDSITLGEGSAPSAELSEKISNFAKETLDKENENRVEINGQRIYFDNSLSNTEATELGDYTQNMLLRNWPKEYKESLDSSKSRTITHTADPNKFAEVFPDVYDESGFTQSGAILGEVQESANVSREDVEKVLPKEISDKVFNEKNEDIIMIKENDVAEHINRWALRGQPSDYEEDKFYKFRENETIPYLRENFPNEVVEVNSLTLGKGYAPSDELSGKISNFAKETLDKENKGRVEINGQRIYFDDSLSNTEATELGDYTQNMLLRNWPKEYKESLDN